MPKPGSEFIVLSHTLLIAAAQLVPVPFLDDAVAMHFRRRMVSRLAQYHGKRLTRTQTTQLLSSAMSRGGCMGTLMLALKEVFREIAFWLEWQRTIDLATESYYTGFLLDEIFAREGFDPRRAAEYGAAIACARKGINTQLVNQAIRKVFGAGRGTVRALARRLSRWATFYVRQSLESGWSQVRLRLGVRGRIGARGGRLTADQDAFEQAVDQETPEIRDILSSMVEEMRTGLGTLPKEHLESLRTRLQDCGV